MKLHPQILEEAGQQDYNYRLDFNYTDIPPGLANNVANTVWPIRMPTVIAGDTIFEAVLQVIERFSATNVPAFTSVTVSFGDTGSATRYLNASQIGSSATANTVLSTAVRNVYTAPSQLVFTLNATTGQSSSNLNKGSGFILFRMLRPSIPPQTLSTPWTGNGYT